MSPSPSNDQVAPIITGDVQTQSRSELVDLAVAIGFAATVSAAMTGWLYLLAVAIWDGANWLMS